MDFQKRGKRDLQVWLLLKLHLTCWYENKCELKATKWLPTLESRKGKKRNTFGGRERTRGNARHGRASTQLFSQCKTPWKLTANTVNSTEYVF